jgi:endonuclease YncB( thermonuclease family)
MRFAVLLACLFFMPTAALAANFSGEVVGVTDGDTISVMKEGKAVKIRLYGIDCPEKRQDFGSKAKQAASDLVYGQTVQVIEYETDRYGRTIAEVVLPDGRSLNHELVRLGFAWWYRKYAPKDTVLGDIEAEARAAKRGLWVDAEAVPP